MKQLGLDYVDLMPIHWPVGNPTVMWHTLEELNEQGLFKSIGVSYFYPNTFPMIVNDAKVMPVVNQLVQEMKGKLFHSVEEVELKYGKPDSVVVLNAAKANEISDVVLSYPERGILVVAGREIPMDDITGIAPKNLAIIPYVVDEYAVVINTKNPAESVIYLRVGYDMGYAREVATQIHEILKSSAAQNKK